MIRIKSGGISGAGIEDSGKMPMWAFFAFLIGLGFQYLLIRNGGLSVTGIVGSIKNGLLMRSKSDMDVDPGNTVEIWKRQKVVIGAISCQKPGTGNVYNEEAALMMKSVIISATLYQIPSLEFHLFLEDIPAGKRFFRGKFKEWGYPKKYDIKIAIRYHSAIDAIPVKYHDRMIYDKKYRCAFVRHFFPTALPNVDSIIYLDTDMIVTGNIGELWGYLGKMQGEQLVGVARNNEPEDTNYDIIHIYGFGDIPHVAPKGVNSGMIVMNLTKMREYNWQTRIVRLYDDYTKITDYMEDQRLLNIILYYDPGVHQLVPCNFDLMHTHCDKGWVCPPALEDPYGVHVIHGAGDQFSQGGSYYHISEAYKKVNLTLVSGEHDAQVEYILDEVVKPIRTAYAPTAEFKSKPDSQCYGTLDKLLFRNWESKLGTCMKK